MQCTARFTSLSSNRPQPPPITQLQPIQTIFRRTLASKINKKAEDKYAHEKIKPTPETVSSTSSVHPLFSEVGTKAPENEVDMMAGVKHDMDMVKDTFDLSSVPRQAYYIGLAGVLPYLGTSLSTIFCSWEITNSVGGSGYVMNAQTAETLLHILEPLQIGYGAVILSFLGAIHWGLEFAGYGGTHGYRRYAIGVLTPAIAWPTLLMPVEYALITQFAAFTMLYYVDVRATYRGWTPPWYSIYRFVLTFIVGASIVVSLVGRGKISGQVVRQPGAVDKITALREAAQETLVREEAAAKTEKEAEEAETDGEEDKDEGKDEGKDGKEEGKDVKEEGKEGKEGKESKENKKEDKKEKK